MILLKWFYRGVKFLFRCVSVVLGLCFSWIKFGTWNRDSRTVKSVCTLSSKSWEPRHQYFLEERLYLMKAFSPLQLLPYI